MPVEFVGVVESGKIVDERLYEPGVRAVRQFDPDRTGRSAKILEEAGFDYGLTVYESSSPDAWLVAMEALRATERLKVLVAHRPGFVAPTVAARKLATLDQYSGGRACLHVVNGSSNIGQERDGDFLQKDDRYRRGMEYLKVFKKELSEEKPFDFTGEFYRVHDAFSDIRPVQKPYPMISSGGSSDAAVELAGTHADLYFMWAEPLAEAARHFARVSEVAGRQGRSVQLGIDVQLVLGDTDEEAWEKAMRIRADAEQDEHVKARAGTSPENVGSQRILELSSARERFDNALYLGIAKATGSPYSHPALVGSLDAVSDALVEYYKIGARKFILWSYLATFEELGRTVIAEVRRKVTELDV
ncbi:alkanesulfonate monooxygenase [Amycolatopsis tolypomycina]|uniref:Alkanesulfonate monooxygenase n=1 Tax=Amycolatopsis tolypomycina TaxID=208445 RepID=A0A1H4YWK1_9PSEU|nr:LLM class flavin-dependent oxidoreductase [Amycolatopsis tolypomycina]SED21381.1 alkanesulfonate monooxygenase [Amycolatopsis tolypomycina]